MQMNNTQMPQAAKNQQPQDTEQTYAVTVDGQTLELTLEVWDDANRSGDLLGAYRAFEIRKLREELEQLRKNADNRRMDVGSARSDGENTITDPIILALMGKG